MFPTVLVPQKQTKGGVFLFRDHSDAHRAASLSDFQRALVSRLGCTRMNSRPGRSLEGRITVMPYDITTEPQAAALSDPVVFHRGAQTGISETGSAILKDTRSQRLKHTLPGGPCLGGACPWEAIRLSFHP